MKSRSKTLLEKAVAATVSAVEIYNKPNFLYRSETFSILAINGWELLLKAKWLDEHSNNARALYVMERISRKDGTRSKRSKIKLARSGTPFTHGLGKIARKLSGQGSLAPNVLINIEALLALRDASVHFYNSSPEFEKKCHEVGAASLKNFFLIVKEWFDYDLSKFNLNLMPLSFLAIPRQAQAIILNQEERDFLNYLGQLEDRTDPTDSNYVVKINIEMKLSRTKESDAVAFRRTNDPNAPEIRMTEEQVLEQFPWDYGRLVLECRKRYSDFKLNSKFHAIKRSLCEAQESTLSKTRHLDPKNSQSSSKQFFKPEILKEVDKHYSQCQK